MSRSVETSEASLTLQGLTLPRAILFVCALVMLGASAYLTNHYYEVQFPRSLVSGSLCDISRFWNCDTAAFSPLASILHVPTSVFGGLIGSFFLLGCLLGRPSFERANYLLALLNALASLGFFLYSLIVLRGLCPGCTIYHTASFIVLLLFWHSSSYRPWPVAKVYLGYALVAALLAGFFGYQTSSEEAKMDAITLRLRESFQSAPDAQAFTFDSPLRLGSASDNFSDAPLRLTVFSDFQCPVCKVLAEDILPKLQRHYRGRINVQYVTYPMDSRCNPAIEAPMHPAACEAAYLAVCAGEAGRFALVHDAIYAHQGELSSMWLEKLAKEEGLAACYHGDAASAGVSAMLAYSEKVGVQGTPTLLVNGKKLEGLLPLRFLISLFDGVLAEALVSQQSADVR